MAPSNLLTNAGMASIDGNHLMNVNKNWSGNLTSLASTGTSVMMTELSKEFFADERKAKQAADMAEAEKERKKGNPRKMAELLWAAGYSEEKRRAYFADLDERDAQLKAYWAENNDKKNTHYDSAGRVQAALIDSKITGAKKVAMWKEIRAKLKAGEHYSDAELEALVKEYGGDPKHLYTKSNSSRVDKMHRDQNNYEARQERENRKVVSTVNTPKQKSLIIKGFLNWVTNKNTTIGSFLTDTFYDKELNRVDRRMTDRVENLKRNIKDYENADSYKPTRFPPDGIVVTPNEAERRLDILMREKMEAKDGFHSGMRVTGDLLGLLGDAFEVIKLSAMKPSEKLHNLVRGNGSGTKIRNELLKVVSPEHSITPEVGVNDVKKDSGNLSILAMAGYKFGRDFIGGILDMAKNPFYTAGGMATAIGDPSLSALIGQTEGRQLAGLMRASDGGHKTAENKLLFKKTQYTLEAVSAIGPGTLLKVLRVAKLGALGRISRMSRASRINRVMKGSLNKISDIKTRFWARYGKGVNESILSGRKELDSIYPGFNQKMDRTDYNDFENLVKLENDRLPDGAKWEIFDKPAEIKMKNGKSRFTSGVRGKSRTINIHMGGGTHGGTIVDEHSHWIKHLDGAGAHIDDIHLKKLHKELSNIASKGTARLGPLRNNLFHQLEMYNALRSNRKLPKAFENLNKEHIRAFLEDNIFEDSPVGVEGLSHRKIYSNPGNTKKYWYKNNNTNDYDFYLGD